MAKKANQKLKILYLRKMLLEESDDEHGLSMAQIIERLEALGIPAERKAIYRDLDSLREFGMDIIKRPNAETGVTEYAVGQRDFEMPELSLLVDAVQSSRFLTERKSQALVRQIRKLASRYQAESLAGKVHVEGRIKMQNESVYYNVNYVQQAILKHRRISFRYMDYDLEKKQVMRKGGKTYVENPVCLAYRNDFYYLITYNDRHERFLTYRLDRMRAIRVSPEPATRNAEIAAFDAEEYLAQSFSMYGGESQQVQLLIDRELVAPFMDRFGSDMEMLRVDEERARVFAPVMVGATFYGWLAQFSSRVRIEAPQSVASGYANYLRDIAALYD